MFQWSLYVVKSAVVVDTGPSYESLSPPTMSRTLWISVFWGLMSYTMRLYVTLLTLGNSFLWIKNHVLVPSMSCIPWKRRPISFPNALVHFGLSGPFIRCLYYWGFPISGNITAFIRHGCIVTSPVVLLVCAQYSPGFWTEYVCTALLGGFIGWTVAMWLAIMLWPCILLDLVLYPCTG